MRVVVIIPVGPGHEQVAQTAVYSVHKAWATTSGPFLDLAVVLVPDPQGLRGRSAARNWAMDAYPADWHFFLDADDWMDLQAFNLVSLSFAATFGAVCLGRKVIRENRWPCTRADLFEYGAAGTLSMGCFVRGDLGLRFNDTLDVGEDFDFYMRLPNFHKVAVPLVHIGYNVPSAGGPRSSAKCQWREACAEVVERYRILEGRP